MMKTKLSGFIHVFNFTLLQAIKNKTYQISLTILVLITLLSLPIMQLIYSDNNMGSIDGGDYISPIEKVYISNQTPYLDLDLTKVKDNQEFKHISFETLNYDEAYSRIEEGEHTAVLIQMIYENQVYHINYIRPNSGSIKEADLTRLGETVFKVFQEIKMDSTQITSEQKSIINTSIQSKITNLNSISIDNAPEDASISEREHLFIYITLFIILMVNTFANSLIANSVVTEKSTKMIEYLLISVKPMTLLFGKIVAMLVATLIQIFSIVIAAFISNQITLYINPNSNLLASFLPNNLFEHINFINIVFCILTIVLGLLFYAILASLFGAMVSRLEELSEGLGAFSIINIIGAYIGMGASSVLLASGTNGFVVFALLFPISSPFLLPGTILVGKASSLLIGFAIILQIVFIILLLLFVSKVYRTLILLNGSRVKPKELLKIAKMK